MKYILTALLLLMSIVSFAQARKQIDSLTFCFNKYPVPSGCSAQSEYQVKCSDYSIAWIYMNNDMLKSMPEQFINQMAEQMQGFKKEPITCYLLEKEVKGYKISYTSDKNTLYQLIAYGVVNEQPVIVQFVLDWEPKTNKDIPEFARQIVRIK